jgi:hypothetical protein
MKRRKLTEAEEIALVQWIISMDDRGMAPSPGYTRQMIDLLLTSRGSQPAGYGYMTAFYYCHSELKARWSRPYDYQRTRCEDSTVINGWFTRVARIKAQYGIAEEDIRNFDETGF